MNIVYQNKKMFLDLVVKLYESDMDSTTRDI